ncbi:MAG TPA: hypothetical protein VE907_23555 [Gammaproteobacteria bacterium]|nr:hypothetical protein [Gammaproteobacteria bacterium]
MRQIKAHVAIAMVLVAGCAAAPDVAEQTPTTVAPIAGSQAAVAAVIPDAVLDIDEINASTSPPLICRDVLKANSNMHVRQCLTEADWKVYERAAARRAEELTRMLQGGLYRR